MSLNTVRLNDIGISVNLARKRMTRKELCRMTGINEGNFSNMMKRGMVRPKTAGKIADALGVDVTEIIVTEDVKEDG